MLLKKTSGFSLLEVTITGAIAVGISLGIMQLTQTSMKSTNKVRSDSELTDFRNYLKNLLNQNGNCGIVLNNGIGNPGYRTNQSTGALPHMRIPLVSKWKDAVPAPPASWMEFEGWRYDASNSFNIMADGQTPIPGFPNWRVERIVIDPIQNESVDAYRNTTGTCTMRFTLNRGATEDPSGKRSFGARTVNMQFDLHCLVHPDVMNNPNEIISCKTYTAPTHNGYWRLISSLDPLNGIEYDYDVLVKRSLIVRQHLITESDQNIKKDIKELDSALENLSKIKGYEYFFKDQAASDEAQLGLIAQEVEKTYPQAVYQNKNGTKGVRYSMLIPVLIQAINEQQKLIKEQGETIKKLENKQTK